jgi:carboxymethylenebutenolidase
VLAIYGGADPGIPPSAVAAFDQALTRAGIEHESITYDGAPHSFFDRKQTEFADASADAWKKVQAFVKRHTSG